MVGVGYGGAAMHSGDGMNWTHTPVNPWLYGVARVDEAWMGFGMDAMVTSVDGLHWDESAAPEIHAAAGNSSVLVGIGGRTIHVKVGNASWQTAYESAQALASVAYDRGRWVVVGGSGFILTSTDATHWRQAEAFLPEAAELNDIASDGRRWVAVGGENPNIPVVAKSEDGIVWTRLAVPGGGRLSGVASDKSSWMAVGEGGNLLESQDGEQWRSSPWKDESNLVAVAGDGCRWVVVDFGRIYTSTGGSQWHENRGNGHVYDVAASPCPQAMEAGARGANATSMLLAIMIALGLTARRARSK